MTDTKTLFLLALTCCSMLAAEGAPDLPVTAGGHNEAPTAAIDPLIDDEFYKEFPEMVDPSAESSKVICVFFFSLASDCRLI